MLTRVKRENKNVSKTTNLCIHLMKAGKRCLLDLDYIDIYFFLISDHLSRVT